MRILLIGLFLYWLIIPLAGQTGAVLIEDFESGAVQLTSWDNEDLNPQSWSLDSSITFGQSAYSLKLFGNTWKQQQISPFPTQPTALRETLHPFRLAPDFAEHIDGYQITAPQKLPRFGSISSVDYSGPATDTELRLGTELIWFGNFEDEGSTLWDVETFSSAALDGERCAWFSSDSGGSQTATISKKMKLNDNLKHHTLHGWIRTRNAETANIKIRYYSARNTSYPISSESITSDITGNTSWSWYYSQLNIPSNAQFYDIQLSFSGVSGQNSQAWFDNVGLIEWDAWKPRSDLALVPHPNYWYWMQLRTQEGIKSIRCELTETAFSLPQEQPSQRISTPTIPVSIYPNPFKIREQPSVLNLAM